MNGENDNQPCPACGGSGQLSTFKGVSRFLLTVEECPECAGTGCLLPLEDGPVAESGRERENG